MKWWELAICVVASLLAVLTPAFLIQPFRPQTERAVTVSHALKTAAPLLTIGLLAVVLLLVFTLWRSARWWSRLATVIAIAVAALSVWFARQNHFEWMFNPLQAPAYVQGHAATFAEDGDLVLAVAHNGDAAAYPIRQLAYHHLVHDIVGGVPIVVTY
jgi:hypothetical protein